MGGSKLGLPDDHGRHYVKLRAQCEAIGFDKETYILVSQRTGTVFLQTDKPLYSPKQNGEYLLALSTVNSHIFMGVIFYAMSLDRHICTFNFPCIWELIPFVCCVR